jgi:glycosyltransferase involved in cell wall biosynthesis
VTVERTLRVALDARLIGGIAGGIEQYIIGLADGLSQLRGPEQYLFYAHPGHTDWIEPHLGGSCDLLLAPRPSTSLRQFVRHRLGPIASAGDIARSAVQRVRLERSAGVGALPVSDGAVEGAGVAVMHFTTQQGFATAIPTIYQPWDLQHLHLPEFFSRSEYLLREHRYRQLCAQAALVAVASQSSRRDVVEHYGVPAERVAVVPVAPPTAAYGPPSEPDVEAVAAGLGLRGAFAFYPAQTWPHKNHLRLLDALARLRDEHDLVVPLICSGRQNEHFPEIEARIRALRLDDQVRFVGYVGAKELTCLYRLARILVFPSLFEGWGFPLSEAFEAGVPVASSDAASLPEQAQDAAILFDATDISAIADAVARLWRDEDLRQELVARGRLRVEAFSWVATAEIFRSHYRRLADGSTASRPTPAETVTSPPGRV